MKLKLFRSIASNNIATTYKNGKMVFNNSACKLIGLSEGLYLAVYLNENNTIYIKPTYDKNPDYFEVFKYSNQFYIPASDLLNYIGIDYKTNNVRFDVIKCESDNEGYFLIKKVDKLKDIL